MPYRIVGRTTNFLAFAFFIFLGRTAQVTAQSVYYPPLQSDNSVQTVVRPAIIHPNAAPASGAVPAIGNSTVISSAPVNNVAVVPASATTLLPARNAPNTSSSMRPAAYQDLRRIVREALDELDPAILPSVWEAKAEMRRAIDELKAYVRIDSPNGQAWSRFLRLPELEQELEKENPSSSKLTELEMNMRQNYIGLEYGPFLKLRSSVGSLVRAVKYGTSAERTVDILQRRMGELLEAMDDPDTTESQIAADAGLVTSYLVESGQAPSATARLRGHYRQPNVQLVARENMLNRLVARSVAEPGPVDECILGTRVLGQACLTGNVLVDVMPMSGGVSLQLQLTGTMTSNNRGYNRGVVLKTTGSSPVVVSKQIIATPRSVTSMPSTAATNLRTRINQIQHRLRIVRRIARRKAAEQKPQADAIAEGRLRRRLRRQYDEEVDKQLVDANTQLAKLQQGRPELRRLDFPTPTYAVYSTSDTVNANVVQAATFQLAARKPCPIPKPMNVDAIVECHQSAIVNAIEVFLAGRTIRNTDLKSFAKQFLGEVPEDLLAEAEGPPWEITMAPFNPVQLSFDDDQVRLTLRISRMEGNEQSIRRGAIISATYTPSYRDRTLALKRDGELEIEVPNVRSANQATALRSVVRKKFDEIFKEEIVTERVDVASRFPRLARFDVKRIKLDDGWIQIGIR